MLNNPRSWLDLLLRFPEYEVAILISTLLASIKSRLYYPFAPGA